MIARIWHGVTAAAKSDEYLDYRATEGNRGVYVRRRIEDERAHFLTSKRSLRAREIPG